MRFNSDIRDFEVLVDKTLWERVKADEDGATDELREIIDGMDVYFHAIRGEKNDIWVSLDELIIYDVVKSMTLHKDTYPG